MIIKKTSIEDAQQIAELISNSNKDVAKQFNLTFENNPKHPSFCTKEWVISDFERGAEYFICYINNQPAGCVSFEHPDPDTAYLNRLSVFPNYRHQGIGAALVNYVVEYSKKQKASYVSIGIIAEHTMLKNWYSMLGFIEGDIQKFEHLPFDVLYMRYDL